MYWFWEVSSQTNIKWCVFKGFPQKSLPQLISLFHAKDGVPISYVGSFLSHSAEKICRGTLECFKKFLVTKKPIDKRGGYHDFPPKNVVSQYHKKWRGTTLSFKKVWLPKLSRVGGTYHDFPSKHFCLTETKQFVGETFCVSL